MQHIFQVKTCPDAGGSLAGGQQNQGDGLDPNDRRDESLPDREASVVGNLLLRDGPFNGERNEEDDEGENNERTTHRQGDSAEGVLWKQLLHVVSKNRTHHSSQSIAAVKEQHQNSGILLKQERGKCVWSVVQPTQTSARQELKQKQCPVTVCKGSDTASDNRN